MRITVFRFRGKILSKCWKIYKDLKHAVDETKVLFGKNRLSEAKNWSLRAKITVWGYCWKNVCLQFQRKEKWLLELTTIDMQYIGVTFQSISEHQELSAEESIKLERFATNSYKRWFCHDNVTENLNMEASSKVFVAP